MSTIVNQIDIFTDGSCLKNPDGPGGWAVVAECPYGRRIEGSGAEASTTNNRMEMTAALHALLLIRRQIDPDLWGDCVINTDSQYVMKGLTEWLPGWKRRGWLTSQGKSVENRDMWEQLETASLGLPVKWRWVRGHAGHAGNERADELAGLAARRQIGSYREYYPDLAEAQDAVDEAETKKRACPIEIDVSLSDAEIASQVRAAVMAANGKIVRFREAQTPELTAAPTMPSRQPRPKF